MSAGTSVAIGGGHGLSRSLRALRAAGSAPTAVVTVADDGGSSGRLRRDLDVIPPGDLRMSLLALARNRSLARALAHRFVGGELDGHALGNLFLVAVAEQEGDVVAALDRTAALLGCAGRVLPATTEPLTLHARIDGRELVGQRHITRAEGHIEEVWISPADPAACAEAVQAIESAELVVLGPGSLFTSTVASLLVPGLRAALATAEARIVYVANLRTQAGETGGLDLRAHVEAVVRALGGRSLDALIAHDGPVSGEGGAVALGTELGPVGAEIGELIVDDLAERDAEGRPGAAHDVERLAAQLARHIAARPPQPSR